jgi:quercetin dioxygenase-like cupin family protein
LAAVEIPHLKELSMKTRNLTRAVLIASGVAALGAAAFATPGSGVLGAPVVARAAFAEPVDIKFKVGLNPTDTLHVDGAKDTVVQQVTIAPGGSTGWHSHPGPVVVLIASGTMSFYDSEDPSCTAKTYETGKAFIDSGQGHVDSRSASTRRIRATACSKRRPTDPPPLRWRQPRGGRGM